MKVSELIALLQQVKNQDALVIMSSDAEGNRKEPFSGDIETGYWCPINSDTVHPDDIQDMLDDEGEEETLQFLATKHECVVLWP